MIFIIRFRRIKFYRFTFVFFVIAMETGSIRGLLIVSDDKRLFSLKPLRTLT